MTSIAKRALRCTSNVIPANQIAYKLAIMIFVYSKHGNLVLFVVFIYKFIFHLLFLKNVVAFPFNGNILYILIL